MGPTWGPPGSCRPQMGPMMASWTLLSGCFWYRLGAYCWLMMLTWCALENHKAYQSESRDKLVVTWWCHMTPWTLVITGSGNGLSDSIKPSPEPMLQRIISRVLCHSPKGSIIGNAYDCNYNMVRWISAPGTMHFRPRYDTFWPCGLFTLLQFCKHPPPPPPPKSAWKLRWVTSVN